MMKATALRRLTTISCIMAATLLGTNAAQAQMVNPFGGYNGPTLSKSDYDVAGGVISKLLNEQPPKLGSTAGWSNPKTGNSGTFTILDIYTAKGLPCRKVKGDVIYGKTTGHPRSTTLSACQVASGQWKTTE